jgi:glutamine amidotransferase
VVLPGVGAFADCRHGLDAVAGMTEALEEVVRRKGRPFFGICVGMQLLADVGREFGDHKGLGWVSGEVVKLEPSDASLKVPHMGWNELTIARPHPLLDGIGQHPHAYFVHSYEFRARDSGDVVATTDYGGTVTAMIARGNIAGTQFHPEKSQAVGLKLLANFLRWNP